MNRLVGPASVMVVALLFFLMLSSPASATPFTGTPSDSLNGVQFPNPRFGTLIDFDDRIAGPVSETDYLSQGIASVKELSGLTLQLFDFSAQSVPNSLGIENLAAGTIRFQFTVPQSRVGIGISDSTGLERLKIYASDANDPNSLIFLEGTDAVFPPGENNAYLGFERQTPDITYFDISGPFFLLDDLQFSAVLSPVSEPATLGLLCCSLAGLLFFASRKKRPVPTG